MWVTVLSTKYETSKQERSGLASILKSLTAMYLLYDRRSSLSLPAQTFRTFTRTLQSPEGISVYTRD